MALLPPGVMYLLLEVAHFKANLLPLTRITLRFSFCLLSNYTERNN